MKRKVMSVFGTRPEANKMCPLVKELESREEIESIVCVTAQHREMLDQMLAAFDVQPQYDLDIMEKQQTLTTITSKATLGLEKVLREVKPDIVLVHGDTTTTFAAALAAFYNHVAIGHVEAGLRSFDLQSPYPEEANRRLVGVMADVHFSPTVNNAENLRRENIQAPIFITGNTAIDALKLTVKDDYTFECPALQTLDFSARKVIAITAHRRENYGEPMEHIMAAFAYLAKNHPDVQLVYPVHLSPYVQEIAHRYLDGLDNVLLTEPLGVTDMHNLLARSYMVMTDSGGLQEEAPALGKPVLVLRRETERPEAVAAGTVRVIGTEEAVIIAEAEELLSGGQRYQSMAHAVNPYGDGFACRRIVDDLLYFLGEAEQPAENFCAQ
ncbi:MAG: UDP-N-acetylglucosamine 2-epimerase (non-hydrolyzing) [Clostridia bacterium]|nr:UDP-N-acetylglucosamine 2-epimerase (non-hydrolyzing) [Clostridia bacterium]